MLIYSNLPFFLFLYSWKSHFAIIWRIITISEFIESKTKQFSWNAKTEKFRAGLKNYSIFCGTVAVLRFLSIKMRQNWCAVAGLVETQKFAPVLYLQ